MTPQINGDLSTACSMDTGRMDWTPSPSGTVWRKRVHLVGPPEAGQVTSVVRYEPDSSFPTHEHPDGEEILVLEGVFSDEQGDWRAGTFLLNPEGFRHAPFSKKGCVLFVKLRQFSGTDRQHVAVDTNTLDWQTGSAAGVMRKPLYTQDAYSDSMELEKWDAGVQPGTVSYPGGSEIFVIDGSFSDENGSYEAGHWLRFPVGAGHRPQTDSGCTLYIKRGGLSDLRSDKGGAR
jgi:anti-sigma factor ChrR (cupin superfamily)